VRTDHRTTPEMSVPFPSISVGCENEGRHRLIMENGEEREREGGVDIQLAEENRFRVQNGSGTVLKLESMLIIMFLI
jgi:hypothetical protein